MSNVLPSETSRYLLGEEIALTDGSLTWVPAAAVRSLSLPDDIIHIATESDTWWTLAARYYRGIERACGLWWAIADYQVPPIADPCLPIPLNRKVRIPSRRTLELIILNEDRREVPPQMLAVQLLSR